MTETKKILLVEDDSFLQELAAKKISQAGYDIQVASTGEEGIEKIKEGDLDLIVLDIMLPGIGGFEILQKIRNHEDNSIKNTPVVMLSNLGQDEEVNKAKKLGANDYMIKAHFTPSDIVKKLREYL
jgi:DNA-binding response OmpR family regulator